VCDSDVGHQLYQRHTEGDAHLMGVGTHGESATPNPWDLWVDSGTIGYQGERLPWSNPVLCGKHQHQNMAAAIAAVLCTGIPLHTIVSHLQSFRGLAHRQEPVGVVSGVTFVNDSKATNADAVLMALQAYSSASVFWLAGGIPKTEGLVAVRPFLKSIRRAYLFGAHRQQLFRDLDGAVPLEQFDTLEEAVHQAFQEAKITTPSVVLLSPGGASFDAFRNFEHRGDVFRSWVHTELEATASSV
jgi:hypothetical protein